MRTSSLLVAALGLGVLAGCGDDGDGDSFEASYARAACERDFGCFPKIRRDFDNDVERCMGSRLSHWQWRLSSFGEECAEATLYDWACEGQASCEAENNYAGECAYALSRVAEACPDEMP